jgi:hypothetical protein
MPRGSGLINLIHNIPHASRRISAQRAKRKTACAQHAVLIWRIVRIIRIVLMRDPRTIIPSPV